MMKKLCLIYISCCLILSALPMHVCAAEKGTFLEGCRPEEGKLQIYCSDIVPEEETAEGCEVSLGGQALTVLSVESEKEHHTPVTYFCLADVSGSMRTEQMAQAKEALLAVVDGMKDGDNMAVGTLGNQTQTSGFLTDKEKMREAVEALEAGREDTNLYAGIVESIRVLQTDTAVNPRKCLIILSDGEDDQKTGITQKEAEKAVTDSSIPVYTVATLKDAGNEAGIENAKLLGSFARMSTGGAHFAPVLDDSTGEQAGQSVILAMEAGFVVSAELPGTIPDKEEALLRMVYTSADNTVYEDTLKIYTEDLGIETAGEPEPEPKPDPELEPDPEPDPDPDPGLDPDPDPDPEPKIQLQVMLPWLAGAAAALIIVIIVVIVLVKKKKKQNDREDGWSEDSLEDTYTESVPESVDIPRTEAVSRPAQKTVPVYELRLYAIGYNTIVHTIRLEQGRKMTVGRNGKADIILDSEDKKLSGVQCSMQWDGGKLYVWDMDSTNGTFVNGVSIKSMGRVAVHEGETIRMGSYEYRVGRR